jgi:hypothetical protein
MQSQIVAVVGPHHQPVTQKADRIAVGVLGRMDNLDSGHLASVPASEWSVPFPDVCVQPFRAMAKVADMKQGIGGPMSGSFSGATGAACPASS